MSANEFIPIRVSTLRGETPINFNAYIRVGSKHILYCRMGDNFLGDQLDRLRKKSLRKLYIQSDDEQKYRAYMIESIESAYSKDSKTPISIRSEVIQGAQQAAAEDLMENPETKSTYNEAMTGADRYIQFLLSEDDALKAILNIENSDSNLAQHGVNVASLAVAIAEKLGDHKNLPLNLLVVGCFIHDFEHFHTQLDIARPISQLNAQELELYKKHPIDGANRLINYKHFDKEVVDIVSQHEELINGQGFPNGLLEKDISPLAQIAGVANCYDRLVSLEKNSAKEAAHKLIVDKVGLYPLTHIEALRSVLKERNITS